MNTVLYVALHYSKQRRFPPNLNKDVTQRCLSYHWFLVSFKHFCEQQIQWIQSPNWSWFTKKRAKKHGATVSFNDILPSFCIFHGWIASIFLLKKGCKYWCFFSIKRKKVPPGFTFLIWILTLIGTNWLQDFCILYLSTESAKSKFNRSFSTFYKSERFFRVPKCCSHFAALKG